MRGWIGLAGLLLSAQATAGNYKIVLDRPANGRLLTGHMGLQAADERTQDTLVRVVAPGNTVDVRGTVRVLVMNLGPRAFTFGPEQVTLRLGNGTVLNPVPMEEFEKRKDVVEQTTGRARAIDLGNRNTIATLGSGGGGGSDAGAPGMPQSLPTGTTADTAGQDFQSDSDLLPGSETLNAIYQLLIPLNVGPQQAWGGYYVFDVPKAVQRARADQPLTIDVRTGDEVHRFTGALHWRS
ncbi:hypothetical protein [Sphingomonas sp.]|uniref:hypothetical protein n=1 Tax=Sphingomonas sp. TaxID=28214 RepID=UPI0025DBF056|nr:hypothetical protein [Sphingomonas sp.]MBV9527992.1 hypothetical protein [Sphingomonas sp.]